MCKTIIFPFNDVVYCKACNVDLDFAKRDTLLTDSAISGSNGAFHERELVQWQPDEAVSDSITTGLDENDSVRTFAFFTVCQFLLSMSFISKNGFEYLGPHTAFGERGDVIVSRKKTIRTS